MKKKSCWFYCDKHLGELDIRKLLTDLPSILEELIRDYNVSEFWFTSLDTFSIICNYILKNLQNKYKNIEMIYFRFLEKEISKEYENFLSFFFDKSVYDKSMVGEFVVREIIKKEHAIESADFCLNYLKKNNKIFVD